MSSLSAKTFNRTSLELKHTMDKAYRTPGTFNRTSLELKHSSLLPIFLQGLAFNRTSLELKRGKVSHFEDPAGNRYEKVEESDEIRMA